MNEVEKELQDRWDKVRELILDNEEDDDEKTVSES